MTEAVDAIVHGGGLTLHDQLRGDRRRRTDYIYMLLPIGEGEEISIDYLLGIDNSDDQVRAEYASECGSPACRRSMLVPTNCCCQR